MDLQLSNLKIEVSSSYQPITSRRKAELIDFMLDNYTLTPLIKKHIIQAITYAIKDASLLKGSYSHGGIVIIAFINQEIVGGLIANRTGLMDFLPQTIISFLATSPEHRRNGIATHLIYQCRKFLPGSIALLPDRERSSNDFFFRQIASTQSLYFL